MTPSPAYKGEGFQLDREVMLRFRFGHVLPYRSNK